MKPVPVPIPRLSAFLERATADARQLFSNFEFFGVLFTSLVSLGAFFLAREYVDFIWAIMAAVLAYSTVEKPVGGVVRRLSERRTRKKPMPRSLDLMTEWHDFVEKRTLDERLHPAVARRLERLAIAREDLQHAKLQSAFADEIHQVADQLMDEAIGLCRHAYRPKGMPRKKWAESVSADPDALFVSGALAEVEDRMAELLQAAEEVRLPGGSADHGLRDLLGRISEHRQAETELDQNLR